LSSRSDDAVSVPLSALQHWIFCPRQWGLIHLDRIWAENRATVEGRLLHERADAGGVETRPGVKALRGVELRSAAHGLHGVADVVELRGGVPRPVEYKRGRPKPHQADEVQACAQAMCLEEMFDRPVPEGDLFYGAIRRRLIVDFNDELRARVVQTAAAIRVALASGKAPGPVYHPEKCEQCSLKDACRPKALESPRPVPRWLRAQIDASGAPE
jgi:CRISPR-associated exonuclease Cas4